MDKSIKQDREDQKIFLTTQIKVTEEDNYSINKDRRTKGRGRFYQQRQRMPKTRTIPNAKTEETEEARGRFNQQRKR